MTDTPDAAFRDALLALLALIAAGDPAQAADPPAIARLEEVQQRLQAHPAVQPAAPGLLRVQFPNFANFQNAFPNFPNFPNFRNVRY